LAEKQIAILVVVIFNRIIGERIASRKDLASSSTEVDLTDFPKGCIL